MRERQERWLRQRYRRLLRRRYPDMSGERLEREVVRLVTGRDPAGVDGPEEPNQTDNNGPLPGHQTHDETP